jgi:hypothetical protein
MRPMRLAAQRAACQGLGQRGLPALRIGRLRWLRKIDPGLDLLTARIAEIGRPQEPPQASIVRVVFDPDRGRDDAEHTVESQFEAFEAIAVAHII